MESKSCIAPIVGSYELTIDTKGRMVIPSEVRRTIDSHQPTPALYLIRRENTPLLYPESRYTQLAYAEIPDDLNQPEELVAYQQLRYPRSWRLELDTQGRIVIPDEVRQSLGKDVALIGVADHLEIYNQKEWKTRIDHLVYDARGIEQRARKFIDQMKKKRSRQNSLETVVKRLLSGMTERADQPAAGRVPPP